MTNSFKFGVLGHNISYSLSPKIFQAVFKQAQIEGTTEIIDCAPEDLDKKIQSIKHDGFDGLSVTIPHKESIIKSLDQVIYPSDILKAVNSVALTDNSLVGYNTDWMGFVFSLMPHIEKIKNKAVIIGNGGAARAIGYGLFTVFNVSEFLVLGRDESKLSDFSKLINNINESITVKTFNVNSEMSNEIFDDAVIVNTTPLGGSNKPDSLPLPETLDLSKANIYYDINYNADNPAIKLALDNKLIAIDGSQMLIAQALESFYLWSGQRIPFKEIYGEVFLNV